MTAAVKSKPKVSIPTLQERATALFEEVLDAPANEAIAVIDGWKETANRFLDELAEAKRPPGVPGPCIKQLWMARAGGNVLSAFQVARKEGY